MNVHKIWLGGLLAACLGAPARAADDELPMRQSLNGPTGLLMLPTARLQRARSGGLIGNWFQDANAATTQNTVAFAGVYGFNERMEGGFYFNRRWNRLGNANNGGGFLKFVLSPEGENEPAMAVGVSGGGGDNDAASAYLVLSRTVSPASSRNPLGLHLGAEYASMRNFPVNPRGASSSVRAFGGFDLSVSQGTSLVGEIRMKHAYELKTFWSGGISHQLGRTFNVTAGVTSYGISQGVRPLVMAGFQFTLPPGR